MIHFCQMKFYPAGRLLRNVFLIGIIILPNMSYAAGEPGLLPMPQKVILTTDRFYYSVGDPCLDPRVRRIMADSIAGVTMNRKEAYSLIVRSDSVFVTATRATGHTMQSEEGKKIVRQSFVEACRLFESGYFHIGTDEVNISSRDFAPEMLQVVSDCGKEVIGWLPGAPLDQKAIRQLWADVSLPQNKTVIDSRYRYLNHTDYYADLFAIYSSRLCNSPSGSELLTGGKDQPAGIAYSPEKLLPEERTRIACIGNSVTYGVGVAGRDTSAYPAVLQGMLGDKYMVGNFGRSGATLLKKGFRPYYRTEEFASALSFKPDIAVIHLGLNDTDPRAWPDFRDEFIGDYLWLIDTLRSVGTKGFYIAKLSPIFNGHKRFKAGTRDWYWQIQERIEEVARLSGATLIDFNTPLKNRPDLLPDNLHPDKQGAAMLAQTVFSAVTGNYGGLQLPQAWSDGMVLQHDRRTRLRGTADRDEAVQVSIAGKSYSAVASATGEWEVSLDPVKAGGPYELVARTASDTIIIRDILAGEVWLCSGQSNMEWPTGSSAGWDEIRESVSDGNLRLINFRRRQLGWNVPWDSLTLAQINNLEYLEDGSWMAASAETVKDFSAVAYYFGRKLREELGVPVGLIEMAVGGSPAEAWIERKALELHPQLVDLLYDYRKSEFREPWVRDVMTANLQLTDNPRQRHPFEPAYLFEAGISKLAGFPIQGFIWYQGESNANFSELYQVLLPEMVQNWRASWADDTLPFYFAQLSSLNRPSWPAFRDLQRRLVSRIPYSGMVVTTDVGHPTDVHPRDKKSVGDRFALLALKETYRKDSFWRSPEPFEAVRKGDKVIVSFRHAGKMKTSDGLPVKEIEVSHSGEFFEPASATIRGHRIIIESAGAVSVRYGWKPFSEGNLAGESGLPVPTFKLGIN